MKNSELHQPLNGSCTLSLRWIRWMMAFLAAAVSISVQGADHDRPVHRVDGSFIREWLILGPISSKSMDIDFLQDTGGEANIRPKEGDTVMTKDGTQLTWIRFRSDHDMVNLEKVFGIQYWSVAYAYCEIESAESIETKLRIGAQVPAIWINGAEVKPVLGATGTSGNVSPVIPVKLKAGRNSCLLKLKVDLIEWIFNLQPLPEETATVDLLAIDKDGRPIPGAVIQFYENGEPVWRLKAGESGRAQACLYPLAKTYDVRATSGEMGDWLNNVEFEPGKHRTLTFMLTPAVSVSGRVSSMDGSPQNAMVVQAIRIPEEGKPDETATLPLDNAPDFPSRRNSIKSLLPIPKFSETVHSDTNGNFQFVNLRPGAYRLRCHGVGRFIHSGGGEGEENSTPPIVVAPGKTAQPVEFVFPRARNGVWRNYRITKGLMELNTMSIHRTPDGLLWIGTTGMLQSYDGVEFKMYQPPQISGNIVESIAHDSTGAVWVGTSSGIARGEEGEFQPMRLGDGQPRDYINSVIADDNGKVWFGAKFGLGNYTAGKFTKWTVAEGLPSNVITSLMLASDGAVWIGAQLGLARLKDGNITVPWLLPGSNWMNITSIHQARDGAIWFGSSGPDQAGVFRFDGRSTLRLGTEEGLLSDQVYDIAESSDGVLWFATARGLSRFDGKTLLNYTMQEGLSNEWVRDIFVDDDDTLWLANGWGVSRFDPNGFIGLTQQEGLKNTSAHTAAVLAIEPHGEGGFWVGTEWGGLYRIHHEDRPVVSPLFPELAYVRQLHRASDGVLWIGTSTGIWRYKDKVLTRELERNWVSALTSDNHGRVWFGHAWNGGGLSRYDPLTGEERLFTSSHGLIDDYVWSLENDLDGGVWIGTAKGLTRGKEDTLVPWNDKLGLPPASVFDIRHHGAGDLWISMSRGLFYQGGNQVHAITTTNGLPDDHIWCSARTRDGIIWIGTDSHGLIGYDGKAMTVLDERDGLEGNRVFALGTDKDDALWAGFLDAGVTRYRRSKSRPSLRLAEVRLDDQSLTNLSKMPTTEIGRRLTVRYQEIDLKTHPDKRQFWYRLANDSGQTLFAGVTRERRFDWTPTSGGTYHFEVQAIDRDLNYSDPARLTFQAKVPWHANAWITVPGVAAMVALLAWGFIGGVLYLRKRREADRMQERARIARDLHDQLGAGLTHLAMLGDFLRQRSDQPAVAQSLAGRLSESAYALSGTIGQVIWATDPAKDTLRSFVSFVSSYAEKFLASSTIGLRLDFPAQLPDLLLPAQLRHHLFMVVKEALNNVAKHAQASQIRITLVVSSHELRLSFEDNGRGFCKNSVAAECHGLANMEKRLREIDGQLEIKTTEGGGTLIEARVPLPRRRNKTTTAQYRAKRTFHFLS